MKKELKEMLEQVEFACLDEVAEIFINHTNMMISDYQQEIDNFAEKSNYNDMYIISVCKLRDSLQSVAKYSRDIRNQVYNKA